MPFYLMIQRLLLLGVHLPPAPPGGAAGVPAVLQPIVDAIQARYRAFDARAVHAGNRYRSAFWAIYLLSSAAVVCAVLPLALAWENNPHLQEMMGHVWGIAEVVVMAVVGLLVWSGSHNDWQGQWLAARTKAEMTAYLPLLAPLVPLDAPAAMATRTGTAQAALASPNWYARVFDGDEPVAASADIEALCRQIEPVARTALAGLWADTNFAPAYARWASEVLANQRLYHVRVAARNRALLHRTHRMNTLLFGLTAAGALAHLFLHGTWLLLLTIFCPALAASLHGAMAQSEAYRLAVTSEGLATELGHAVQRLAPFCQPADGAEHLASTSALQEAVTAAIALLLNEHQDWHMLVRPHHLPLA